jgi:hypothetical protein
MGRIDLLGSFQLSRPLRDSEMDYLNSFSQRSRQTLNTAKLQEVFQGEHGNPFPKRKGKDVYGTAGEYFVGSLTASQATDMVVSHAPPTTQPSSWCHWVAEGTRLFWDGEEEFEKPVEWLRYVIRHFLDPWGIALDGAVQWQGFDSPHDRGTISVWCSKIHVHQDMLDSESESESDSESN